MSNGFTILTVCTGNICRSPLAEQLLARRLGDIDGITVESAGSHAMIGAPMSEQSQEIARGLGVPNPSDHRARQLTEGVLDSADLIFAMARDHRRTIVETNPRVARRVFTLLEFARLAEATTDEDLALDIAETSGSARERLQAAVVAAAAGRAMVLRPADPTEDDVVDPYLRSAATYARSTDQIVPAVDVTAAFLRRALEVPVG